LSRPAEHRSARNYAEIKGSSIVTVNPTSNSWSDARHYWISGLVRDDGTTTWPSAAEIAYLTDLAPTDITDRAMAENWDHHKDAHRARTLAKVRTEAQVELETRARRLDLLSLRGAEAGMEVVVERTEWLRDKHRSWVRAQAADRDESALVGLDPTFDPFDVSPIDGAELRALSGALTAFQAAGERALGRPDTRAELTGADGGPLSVASRLTRDDGGDRVASLIEIIARTRHNQPIADTDIMDAELEP
jgi:hypothetical protein